jgi:hypothetical protein
MQGSQFVISMFFTFSYFGILLFLMSSRANLYLFTCAGKQDVRRESFFINFFFT